jgi:hypothetical protein
MNLSLLRFLPNLVESGMGTAHSRAHSLGESLWQWDVDAEMARWRSASGNRVHTTRTGWLGL